MDEQLIELVGSLVITKTEEYIVYCIVMAFCMPYYDFSSINMSTEDVANFQKGLLHDHVDRIMIGRILPLMFVLGLLGNLAFLFTMLRVKWMRTVTNYYLANLAVADLLFLLFVVGDKILAYNTSELKGNMILGQFGCIIKDLIVRITFYASLALVTLVSLERFYAICKPVQHRVLNGKKGTIQLIAMGWILSAGFALILLPSHWHLCVTQIVWLKIDGFHDLPSKLYTCNALSSEWMHASEGLTTVPFIIALVTNTYLYTNIIISLHVRANSKVAKSTQSIEIRNQVALMLAINGIVFFLCLAPFQMMSFTRMIRNSLGMPGYLSPMVLGIVGWVLRILVYLNSIINPIVYTATSPRYRQGFIVAFTCSEAEFRNKYNPATTTEKTCNTKI